MEDTVQLGHQQILNTNTVQQEDAIVCWVALIKVSNPLWPQANLAQLLLEVGKKVYGSTS